jgi:hypothetical protein
MSQFVTKVKKTGCSKCRFSKLGCSGPRCKRVVPLVDKGSVPKRKNATPTRHSPTQRHDEVSDDLEQKSNGKKKMNPVLRFIDDEVSESSDESQSSEDSQNDSSSDSNEDEYDLNDGFLQEEGVVWKQVGGEWTKVSDAKETENRFDDNTDEISFEHERQRTKQALDELSTEHKKNKTLKRKLREQLARVQKLEKRVRVWKRRAIEQLLKNDKYQEQNSNKKKRSNNQRDDRP